MINPSPQPRTAKLSVIIPTLNAQKYLPDCLDALLPGVPRGLIREVIIVDGGSKDDTLPLASAAGCRVISATRGRGRQLQTGARAAHSDWLLFLHADTQLDADWLSCVSEHMDQKPGHAASFRLVFKSTDWQARWVEFWVILRTNWLGLPYGDQGLLISRDLYESVGGYSDLTALEDLEFVDQLGRKRLCTLPCLALTSAAKYENQGWVRHGARNIWLLLRYLLGISPERLAKERHED